MSMKLEVKMLEIPTKLDSKLYQKYILTEKVKPVHYVDLNRYLYGTLHAAMLFCKNLNYILQ